MTFWGSEEILFEHEQVSLHIQVEIRWYNLAHLHFHAE